MAETEKCKTRVLVVEDDENLRGLIELHLQHDGFESIVASTGRQALDVLETTPVDVVVTDLLMPEADGFEVLQRLRAKGDAPPVILITGGGRRGAGEYVEIAKVLGAAATLQKPFTLPALTETIQRFVSAPEAERRGP